jgi:hypothetical protein
MAVDKLKADLDELNLKCQTARDNEVRYALQRSRLEAERAQLLVKIMETMSPSAPAPYNIVVSTVPAVRVPVITPLIKPVAQPQLPSLRAMIEKALESAIPHGLLAGQIIGAVKTLGRPEANKRSIYATISLMLKAGRIGRTDGRYYAINKLANGANGAGAHP